MKIESITAYPLSFAIPKEFQVTLGIGSTIKRDSVLVKVVTSDGIIGWGEAHAGRAPGAVAQLANTTLRTLVTGMEATDVVGVWDRIYKMQLASHGMGAATAIAMSGIDMALWLVGQIHSPAFARKVQRAMEYDPAPPYAADV